MQPADFEAYLARIGLPGSGALTPTHAGISGVLRAHMETIPFENIDVLLGRRVRVDVEGVVAKLVEARRGGYCFEHATLLQAALEHVGIRSVAHAARVVMFLPRAEAPRTHMFLTVETSEGRFVLDPGFGLLAPRVPVPLVDGRAVRCGAEEHVMVRDGAGWVLRARRNGGGQSSSKHDDGDGMVDCWISTLERELPIDIEVANHYTSTHPASAFRNRLMLRALLPDGRISAMNRDVTTVRGDRTETTLLADRAALRALLAQHFGFDLPEIDDLRVPSEPSWAGGEGD